MLKLCEEYRWIHMVHIYKHHSTRLQSDGFKRPPSSSFTSGTSIKKTPEVATSTCTPKRLIVNGHYKCHTIRNIGNSVCHCVDKCKVGKKCCLNAKMSVRSCFPAWISDDSCFKGNLAVKAHEFHDKHFINILPQER